MMPNVAEIVVREIVMFKIRRDLQMRKTRSDFLATKFMYSGDPKC
jgi:hypothetical protein